MIENVAEVPETLAAALAGRVACTQIGVLLLPEMLPAAEAVVVRAAPVKGVPVHAPDAIRICHAEAAESRAVNVEPAVPVLARVNCWRMRSAPQNVV